VSLLAHKPAVATGVNDLPVDEHSLSSMASAEEQVRLRFLSGYDLETRRLL
jgi:hypothetical protein